MRNHVSEKQLAANRRNARKSTGPRTAQGRSVSKLNALKHGILSRQVLVRGQYFKEDEKELEALHLRFHEDLAPEGPVEEMLVDQIVTAQWRLRRALTAEAGEIALSVDGGHRRRNQFPDPVVQWMRWTAIGDPVHSMEQDRVGVGMLLRWLSEVREAVEREGELTDAAVQKLAARFDNKPNTLVLSLQDFRASQGPSPAVHDGSGREQRKTEALRFLDKHLGSLNFVRLSHAEDREFAEEAQQAAAVLPSAAVLDKIHRYETKLERQMFRAMAQLERVQRMRRGEDIPAPVAVEVSSR
jgi:hypothetical protein